jgi:DNA-binding MarR family transcriptional regulator
MAQPDASVELHSLLLDDVQRQWLEMGRSGLAEMLTASWLIRAEQQLVTSIEAILRPLDLTVGRFECLMVLIYSKNHALGLTKMSERLGVHPTTITYAVDQLELRGLVTRVPHPVDRRRTLAALTEEGAQLAQAALDVLEEQRFGMSGLTTEEYEQTTRLLRRVTAGVLEAAGRRITVDEEEDPLGTSPRVARAAKGRARRGAGRRRGSG